jgi:hypothetical protein
VARVLARPIFTGPCGRAWPVLACKLKYTKGFRAPLHLYRRDLFALYIGKLLSAVERS